MLAIMVNFNLPFMLLQFIVRLVTLHLPRAGYTSQLCTSYYRLAKFFDFLKSKAKRIFYCDQCHCKLPRFIATARRGKASKFPCHCKRARTGYMVLLDVADEMHFRLSGTRHVQRCILRCTFIFLQRRLLAWAADPHYCALLAQSRLPREDETFGDLYDGSAYRCVGAIPL